MSKTRLVPQPDSDSDFSESKSRSSSESIPSPRHKPNIQASTNPKTTSQPRLDPITRFRSSPPIVPSSSKTVPQGTNDVQQSQSLDTLASEPSSSQQNLQPHHLGPFTSSPTRLHLPQTRQFQSQSKSPSPSSPQRRRIEKHPLRPNTYLGPPSTWREWTQNERTTALSLERTRAQDLSAHLYCVHVLRKKAELAKSQGKSLSRSRSRSRSQNRSKNKIDKGKGKAREDLVSSPGIEPTEEEEEPAQEEPVFLPPRLWTAWPLPPSEVPREEFLPSGLLGVSIGNKHMRPGAELEECLIAVTSRYAKERWNARGWEPENDEDNPKLSGRESKRQKRGDVDITKGHLKHESQKTDTEMEDSAGAPTDQDEESQNDGDHEIQRPLQAPASTNDFPMFSSQLFTAPSSSSPSSQTSHSSNSNHLPPRKPVFSADDDRLRQLLLPSTRHVTSQLDDLLLALHKIQRHSRRKSVNVGGRGYQEILSIASVMFSDQVVGRARERCERLLNG